MGSNLYVVVLSLVTIFGFLYKYTGEQYISISSRNQIISTLETNFLPYNKIIKEGYSINCIKSLPKDELLRNKEKTIVYFINGDTDLSFDCSSTFYKDTGFYRSTDSNKICKTEEQIDIDIITFGGIKKECNATLRIQELYSRLSQQCIVENTMPGFDVKSCISKVTSGMMLGDGYTVCGTTFGSAIFGCTIIQL